MLGFLYIASIFAKKLAWQFSCCKEKYCQLRIYIYIYIGPDRVAQLEERRASISKVAGSNPTADRQNFLLVRFGRTHALEIISTYHITE